MKKYKWEAAYFTVEASLLFPLVMIVIVIMIFLAFYSYDRCILEHSAYEAALRGAENHLDSAKEIEDVVCLAAGRLVEEKLIAVYDFHYNVEVNAEEIIVSYFCTVNMPMITWISDIWSNLDLSLEICKSAKRYRPTRVIRDYRIINSIVKNKNNF